MKPEKPLSRELTQPEEGQIIDGETQFEKPRGLHSIQVMPGFARAEVHGLAEPLMESRIDVLKALSDICINFVKLTATGIAFVFPSGNADEVEAALKSGGFSFDIQLGRSIVMGHSANIRDEEGLAASVISEAIASGASIDQFGDNHDRILIAADEAGAALIAERLRLKYGGDQ
jgi:aspartokinase